MADSGGKGCVDESDAVYDSVCASTGNAVKTGPGANRFSVVLRFQPFTADHAEAYARIRARHSVARYLKGGVCNAEEALTIATQQSRWSTRAWVEHGHGLWAIFWLNNEMVGVVGGLPSEHQSTVTVFYAIDPCFWNRGIATRGLQHAVDHLVSNSNRHLLCARVHADNTGSLKVLSRCGFQPQSAKDCSYPEMQWFRQC